MRTVYPGETVTFYNTYAQDIVFDPYDADTPYDTDAPYEDLDILVSITKNATTYLAGPFRYTAGQITRDIVGTFFFTYTFPLHITPGIYQIKWETLTDTLESIYIETISIVEISPDPNNILDAPRTYGIMIESPLYKTLGVGETDRLYLVGHADGLVENEPYQVINMQEAVNRLGAAAESPMIRALLEAYNAGARDIWLVSAAPEGEYVPFDPNNIANRFKVEGAWGGLNFYQRYHQRLTETYSLIQQHHTVEIIVPIDAPAYGTGDVDFLGQLVDHCLTSYEEVGTARIGIIGIRLGNFSDDDLNNLVNDPKFDINYGDGGKFVMVLQGEATFSLPQIGTAHTSSIAVAAAATLATQDLSVGLTYKSLKSVMAPYGKEMSVPQYRMLSAKKINPLIRTAPGRRGNIFSSIIATDNTLASDGSDFWSVTQIRLISKIIQRINTLGSRYLGTIGFMQFRSDAYSYMDGLVRSYQIRDFEMYIARDQTELNKAIVEINVSPFLGVRELSFRVAVGPGV